MNASEDRLPLRKRQACHPQITQISQIGNCSSVKVAPCSSLLLNLWNLRNLRIPRSLNSLAFPALHVSACNAVARDNR